MLPILEVAIILFLGLFSLNDGSPPFALLAARYLLAIWTVAVLIVVALGIEENTRQTRDEIRRLA